MKRQRWRLLLTVICVLTAGICYSCSRQMPAEEDRDAEVLILHQEDDLWEESVLSETEETAPTTEAVQQTALCYVHICGAVASPGVYEMEPGARVFQVVEQAGGFTEDAAGEYLNLAREVEDGMQIIVPSEEEVEEWEQVRRGDFIDTGGVIPELGDNQGTVSDGRVNLNTATKAELMTLSGIGEVRAEEIIRYREDRGPFSRIEDIKKVPGIKDAAFQKIKDDITV